MNIAIAKWGTHLPIAHALRLLSTQELRFGLTKLKLRKTEEQIWPGDFFLGGGGYFLGNFLLLIFSFLDENEFDS